MVWEGVAVRPSELHAPRHSSAFPGIAVPCGSPRPAAWAHAATAPQNALPSSGSEPYVGIAVRGGGGGGGGGGLAAVGALHVADSEGGDGFSSSHSAAIAPPSVFQYVPMANTVQYPSLPLPHVGGHHGRAQSAPSLPVASHGASSTPSTASAPGTGAQSEEDHDDGSGDVAASSENGHDGRADRVDQFAFLYEDPPPRPSDGGDGSQRPHSGSDSGGGDEDSNEEGDTAAHVNHRQHPVPPSSGTAAEHVQPDQRDESQHPVTEAQNAAALAEVRVVYCVPRVGRGGGGR